MALHPLTDEQLKLLNEFKSSGLSVNDFASNKQISYHAVVYLINKERRLKDETTIRTLNNRFVSIPLEKEHITPESFDVISNDVIAFSINDLMFKMTAQNLKKFMEAIKQ